MVTKYKTIHDEVKTTISVKKSKFICVLKPVTSEEEAQEFIQGLKKEYYDARHHCVAYIIGVDKQIEKANDDGEPQGTAGKPMLEVLRGEGLTNICAVVIRYFGGTLLGTGGLIKAYTESVKESIQACKIDQYKLCQEFAIDLDYTLLAKVEYELRQQDQLISEVNYGEKVDLIALIDYDVRDNIFKILVEKTNDKCEIIRNDNKYVLYGE